MRVRGLRWCPVVLPVLLLGPGARAACPSPPDFAVTANSDIAPGLATSEMTQAQIDGLARDANFKAAGQPHGFYVGRIDERVDVTWAPAIEGCRPAMLVHVTLSLHDRRIVLANSLDAVPCLRDAERAHYARHAAADALVVAAFSDTIEGRIGSERQALRAAAERPDPLQAVRQEVVRIVQSTIPALHGLRSQAQHGVNTEDESLRVSSACVLHS